MNRWALVVLWTFSAPGLDAQPLKVATIMCAALVEFPADRWKVLVREGSLHSITGAGVRSGNASGLEESGIFAVSLSEVSNMEVRETDTRFARPVGGESSCPGR